MLKKSLKIIGLLLALLLVGTAVYLKSATYTPESSPETVQEAHPTLNITNQANAWQLLPEKDEQQPAILLYPGALVKASSYLPLAAKLANRGFPTYIAKMPFNLAIFQPNKAKKIIEENDITQYLIGGHSLGGVMASRFAHEAQTKPLGVFFLASYPDAKGELLSLDIPALSITAENDHVLNETAFEEAKHFLPDSTRYATISGGNHAGFGQYGPQNGDGAAVITNEQQHEETTDLITHWISTIK